MNEIIIEGVTYVYIARLYNSREDRYIVSLRKNGKYHRTLEHIRIWILHNERHVPGGFIIHHINKDKNDNRIENLQLVTRGEHNKLHAYDINHYMFRKGHTYWSHPKSEQHKLNIKEGHIKRNIIEYNYLYKIATESVCNNPNITMKQLIDKLGRKSHKVFRRIFNTTFKLLKQDIIGKQLNVSEVTETYIIDSHVQCEPA